VPLSFGTDGVRGRANDELTPEHALRFGRAVVVVLGAASLLVGRDTRRSGAALVAAVCAGAASEGADVVDLGVLPTPAVALRCARDDVAGIVVSASHNPFEDNGLKVFAAGGAKLDASLERAIEAEAARIEAGDEQRRRPTGPGVGNVRLDTDAHSAYAAMLLAAADPTRLDGLHVVVDCANGAASGIAEEVLGQLGATVTAIGVEPDGCNINDGVGSTAPEAVAAAVAKYGADLGLAFDGDADRCVAVDRTGHVFDGDWLLALFATERKRRGLDGGVVVTVMSNLGFHRAMQAASIAVEEVPVGDRNVLEALRRTGWVLGGEQSGHLVFADRSTTGDGILTGVLLCQLVASRGPLDELARGLLTPVPQVLVNVEVADARALEHAEVVWQRLDEVRAALGERGRVVLRASGTEPCVRIMAEAEDEEELGQVIETLRSCVLEALGGPQPHG
jgi:phosphoglucosamine mutase